LSFLGAAFLLALPLIAVPVAIHLYRGRQRDVIMWGAMQFLASAVTKGRRMERLEELLLMLLRLGAVAALVFALARPMVKSSWFGDQTDRQVILVLDNSLSMSREAGGESADAKMKAAAAELIEGLSETDGVQILLAAGSEWAMADDVTADAGGRDRLAAIVSEVEPTQGTADLLACLQTAVHLESDDQLAGRRIVVFTDSQKENWQLDAAGAWQQLATDRGEAKVPTTIEIVDCGLESEAIENLAVTRIEATQKMVRPEETLAVAAEVRNLGTEPTEATRAEWLVDGKVMEESRVGALRPSGSARVRTTLRFEEPGIRSVTCRLVDADQLPLDQENGIVVEVADQLPVLFVEGGDASGSSSSSSVTAGELFSAALGFKGDEAQTWHAVYRPEVIPVVALSTHPLTDYRAIVINDVPELTGETLERLDSFVRSGGGLWLAAGEASDPAMFKRDWYSDGAGLAPLALEELEVVPKADDAAATIHPPTRDHSATVQLANTTQLDIDEARLRQYWKFGEQAADQEAVSTLVESGSGRPLVVENFVGEGRVLVQAFPLGLEWTNVPLLKAYVVMVQDWLGFLTAPTTSRYNLEPGSLIVASAPADARGATAELVTPRGRAIPLTAADAEVAPVFRYSQTTLPGTYRVRFKEGDATVGEVPYQVSRDAVESDLEMLRADERAKLAESFGVQFGETPVAAVGEVVAAAPRQEPVWTYLLGALVMLLVAELFLANLLARQRQGMEVAA
jgi:hypothetical protein